MSYIPPVTFAWKAEKRVLNARSESLAREINNIAVSACARRVVSVCAIELRSARSSSCNTRTSPLLAMHPVVLEASTTEADARQLARVSRVRIFRRRNVIMCAVCSDANRPP